MFLQILVYTWAFLHCAVNVQGNEKLPVLTIYNQKGVWNSSVSNETGDDVRSTKDKNAKIDVVCTASYPIQWNITGYVSNPHEMYFMHPERDFEKHEFGIHVGIDFANTQASAAVSLKISCEKVKNWKQSKTMYVFVQRARHTLFERNKGQPKDPYVIPCVTSNPSTDVELYRQLNTGNETLVKSRYYPTEGFRTDNRVNGTYTCRQGKSSINLTFTDSPLVSNDFLKSDIKVFMGDPIVLECFSKSKRYVEITVNHEHPISVVYNRTADFQVTARLTSNVTVENERTTTKGTAMCVEHSPDADHKAILKKWSYTFVQTPTLKFGNDNDNDKQVQCVSTISPQSVLLISCDTGMHCDFKKKLCVDNQVPCSDETWPLRTSKVSKVCSINNVSKPCVAVSQVEVIDGVFECTVSGLVKKWEYFKSLDSKYYSNWKDAPFEELFRMENVSIPLYADEKNRFVCRAVRYLFANALFEIEYKNGLRDILKNNADTVKIWDGDEIKEFEDLDHNVVGILDIKYPIDAIAIHCTVGWWNSTEFYTASVNVVTREISEDIGPQITNPAIYISIITLALVSASMLIAVLAFLSQRRSARQRSQNLTQPEIEAFFDGMSNVVGNDDINNAENVEYLPYNKQLEILSDDIEFGQSENNLLGSGQFGVVVKGLIRSSQKTVAVKISKPSTDVTTFKNMLSEIKIMSYVGQHENIISLIGVCTEKIQSCSLYIVTEICELGSLLLYLRKFKDSYVNLLNANQEFDSQLLSVYQNYELSTSDLISFSTQIAKGMEYLAHKSVIHGDLAARNVLLTNDKIAKISDFGLSKKLYEDTNYIKKSKTPIPWRWMAIESLKTRTFSTSSDVWAYGVTLYEIFTLGDTPFPSESWTRCFVTRLENGLRMEKPEYCTQEMYYKMLQCWENLPNDRPTFTSLREFFERMSWEVQSDESCLDSTENKVGQVTADAYENDLYIPNLDV